MGAKHCENKTFVRCRVSYADANKRMATYFFSPQFLVVKKRKVSADDANYGWLKFDLI